MYGAGPLPGRSTLKMMQSEHEASPKSPGRSSYIDGMLQNANRQRKLQSCSDLPASAFASAINLRNQESTMDTMRDRLRVAGERDAMEHRIQLEMERRATYREVARHGVPIEQVEAALKVQQRVQSEAADIGVVHGGYLDSLMRRAESTMVGKQNEIDAKVALHTSYHSEREAIADRRLADVRSDPIPSEKENIHADQMQHTSPSTKHEDPSALRTHINGIKSKIASYRSEKVARAPENPPCTTSDRLNFVVPGDTCCSPGSTLASVSPCSQPSTYFTSPSPVRQLPTQFEKPEGMQNEQFERLRTIQDRIGSLQCTSADSPATESIAFAITPPDKSPPRSSIEQLRSQLNAVNEEIKALETE